MNKGSQPSVNSFCCFSTMALAYRDGTINGLSSLASLSSLLGTLVQWWAEPLTQVSSLALSSLVQNFPTYRDSQDLVLVRCQEIQIPELGVGLYGKFTFPPLLHCNCPRKLNSISSGFFTYPKSTMSLIRGLSSSCLHQFSAVPSSTLIKLILEKNPSAVAIFAVVFV